MIKQYTKKNGEKLWYFKTYLGIDPTTGKKKYTTRRGFKTKKEAKTAMHLLENSFTNNKYITEQSYTFNQIKELWLQQYKSTVKASTYLRVEFLFNQNISLYFGENKIQKYKVPYCQNAANEWKTKYSTYKALKSYTSSVFDYAVQMNLIAENPMKQVTFSKGNTPKQQDKTENFYDKEELKQFLEACSKDFKYPMTLPMFRVLAFTGMRKGELLALTWKDVDFFNKRVNIHKTVSRGIDKQLCLSSPKTASSFRDISLDETTLQILKKWKKDQKKILFKLGHNATNPNQLVFSTMENGIVALTQPNRNLNRICKENNLKEISVHGFRHTHCSLLFEAGLSLKDVQERLGHTDIKTTMDIYAHVTKQQKEKSADKFAAYINF